MAIFIEMTGMDNAVEGIVVAGITRIVAKVDPGDAVNNEKTVIHLASGAVVTVQEQYADVKAAIIAP